MSPRQTPGISSLKYFFSAKVDDATSLSVTGLKWFKIAEEGLDKATGKWAVDKLIANNGRWDIKIPDCIPPGQYLLRHELVALHSAASYPGAQFYVSVLFGHSRASRANSFL